LPGLTWVQPSGPTEVWGELAAAFVDDLPPDGTSRWPWQDAFAVPAPVGAFLLTSQDNLAHAPDDLLWSVLRGETIRFEVGGGEAPSFRLAEHASGGEGETFGRWAGIHLLVWPAGLWLDAEDEPAPAAWVGFKDGLDLPPWVKLIDPSMRTPEDEESDLGSDAPATEEEEDEPAVEQPEDEVIVPPIVRPPDLEALLSPPLVVTPARAPGNGREQAGEAFFPDDFPLEQWAAQDEAGGPLAEEKPRRGPGAGLAALVAVAALAAYGVARRYGGGDEGPVPEA
jgi:hypothetical protein